MTGIECSRCREPAKFGEYLKAHFLSLSPVATCSPIRQQTRQWQGDGTADGLLHYCTPQALDTVAGDEQHQRIKLVGNSILFVE